MSIRRIINSFTTQPLLDLYPIDLNMGAAWSLRKLRSDYTGHCIRVRRSSDNAEMDIGFSGNSIDVQTLLSFVGNGNAYIKIFYDQSGNGKHLVQTNITRQPQIADSGTIITENQKPAIKFDGNDDYLEVPDSQSYFKALHCSKALVCLVTRVAYTVDPNIACGFVDTGGALNSQVGYTLFYDDRSIFNRNEGISNISANGILSPMVQVPNNILFSNIQNIIMNSLSVYDIPKNRSIIVINDFEIKNNNNSSIPSIENSSKTLKIGCVNTNSLQNFLYGTIQEVIIYLNDQTAFLNDIKSNMNSNYNTY